MSETSPNVRAAFNKCSVWILICISFIMTIAPQILRAKGIPIEEAQRNYQARVYFLTGQYDPFPPSKCGKPAPPYPPDGFYGDDLDTDPDFAATLVADLDYKLCEGNTLYLYFLDTSTNYLEGLPGPVYYTEDYVSTLVDGVNPLYYYWNINGFNYQLFFTVLNAKITNMKAVAWAGNQFIAATTNDYDWLDTGECTGPNCATATCLDAEQTAINKFNKGWSDNPDGEHQPQAHAQNWYDAGAACYKAHVMNERAKAHLDICDDFPRLTKAKLYMYLGCVNK